MTGLKVRWIGTGRAPQCPPNPDYPNGIRVDMAGDSPGCDVSLPYPAPCIGTYWVACSVCDARIAITAAGRIDDPTSVKIPCKLKGTA